MFTTYLSLGFLIVPIMLVIAICIIVITNIMGKALSHKELMVIDNTVVGKKLGKINRPVKEINLLDKEIKVYVLKDVAFLFSGQILSFQCELFEKAQRYYLPLHYMTKVLGGSYYEDSSKIEINHHERKYTIDKKNLSVSAENITDMKLRGGIMPMHNKTYLCLSDIENIFNLYDKWDYHKKQISMYEFKENLKKQKLKSQGIAALIRLEDVTAGEELAESENLEKMKIIADYLYSESVKFHVAWVSRYKNPSENIDNNLLEISNMQNAQFINMLDYIIFRGGIIGVHGYTHQYGDETSVSGSELTENYNNDIKSTTKIVEAALETAIKLNIPIGFFETPHYGATELQQSVIEDYFQYIYEPYVGLWNDMPIVSPRNHSTIYVPTPLSYVEENNIEGMLNRIKTRPSEILASLYYHPSKELDFINFYVEKDGRVVYTYSKESYLHKIVDTLKDKGYITININQIE